MSQGTIVAHVFTSNAMLPIQGAAVSFTKLLPDGTSQLLAFRTTNYDGFTDPITVQTPDLDSRELDSSGQQPYETVTVTVDQPGYDRVIVENAQIFTGVQTLQELMLAPTPQLPEQFGKERLYIVPSQIL